VVATSGAFMLSTQAHRILLKAGFPAMSALRRVAVGLLMVILCAGLAYGETARITFLLVNDIYLMTDQMMPDGKRRGGFARLAAVVKAERAKGGNVIFAHAGDTLSPSLMSGIDNGAHIIALTNLIPPDVFAPGNHEFDFGKATFLERMGEANFPLYAANLRGSDGTPLPNFKDRTIVTVDGVRIGLTGATYDDSPRASDPGDLLFLPTVATLNGQAEALRREGADFVVAVAHVTREQGYEVFRGRAVDLILTGHTHDLFIEYDGRTAMVESSFDAHYVTAIDVSVNVDEEDGRRRTTWWPQFRIIDTATVTPDPEVAAAVARYEAALSQQIDAPIGTTAVELDSRTATVRTREAAIGDLIADAMRWSAQTDVAVTNGGGIRSDKVYLPGSTITRRDILAELPFGNRLVTLDMSGAALKAAIENGLSRLPNPSGRFPQVAGLEIEAEVGRPAGNRILSIKVGGAPLDMNKTYSVATNDFMARGGDDYIAFRDAKLVLPPNDSPMLAYEVIDYIKSIGTIRNAVDGRIVLK
jgi:2',3'-cyclic-nucleotide 2'-phosphodiesterase (5'-nucleotidase family)